jgi:hypothetical protein
MRGSRGVFTQRFAVSVWYVVLAVSAFALFWGARARAKRRKPVLSALAIRTRESRGFQMREYDFFRIHYSLCGPHAVPRASGGGDDCPAQVEDVATQFLVAHHVFCDLAGFRHPLDSPFFPRRRYIDVYLFHQDILGGHNKGRSFSVPAPANDSADRRAQASSIYLLRDFNVRHNVTPTHEYFHQIQNGMTRITNAWFYEGMARWSQEALHIQFPVPVTGRKAGPLMKKSLNHLPDPPLDYPAFHTPSYPRQGPPALLHDPAALKKILKESYHAAQLLWIPLANCLPDAEARLPVGDPLLRARYSDGTPVMQDHIFRGARFMRTVLEELEREQEAIYRKNRFRGGWTSKNRRDPRNDRYILEIVRSTAERLCP